jgi:hypothetical protein
MIQIFSTCKPWLDIDAVMQRNAITSWTKLPRVDILLIGSDEGTAEFASEMCLCHAPEVGTNEQGTPLVPSLWDVAGRDTTSDILAYVNADIILLDDFVTAVECVASQRDQFLIVGRRYNTHLRAPIDFAGDWQAKVREYVARGYLYAECAIDYFVWCGDFWGDLPPIAIGRYTWDNVVMGMAVRHGVDIVDATESITAIHQLHGKLPWEHPEAVENRLVARGSPMHGIKSAQFELVDGVISRRS